MIGLRLNVNYHRIPMDVWFSLIADLDAIGASVATISYDHIDVHAPARAEVTARAILARMKAAS